MFFSHVTTRLNPEPKTQDLYPQPQHWAAPKHDPSAASFSARFLFPENNVQADTRHLICLVSFGFNQFLAAATLGCLV